LISKSSTQQANTSDTTAPPFTYNAFLSYRSETDYKRARKIEGDLESFHKRVGSKTVDIPPLQICRDGSDFTLSRPQGSVAGARPDNVETGIDLIWSIIQSELSKSEYLIVLCSPGSINSPYVAKEIQWFIENRGKEWIIPVVTEAADPKNRPEECFPKDLMTSRLHESLIWYDLRGRERSQRKGGVKDHEDELVRLASDLLNWNSTSHGPLAALWQRERSRQRRRQAFLALIVAAVMFTLGGYALVTAQQRERALLEVARTIEQNKNLIDQRDKEVAERERIANERDRSLKERDRSLQDLARSLEERDKARAGEKEQTVKAVLAAKNEAIANEERRKKEKESVENERVALIESGRDALANRDPFQAAVYLSRAYKISPADEDPAKKSSLLLLLGLAMRSVDPLLHSVTYGENINSVKFSPNGRQIAFAGADDRPKTKNTARVLEVKTGKQWIDPVMHDYDVNTVEFSPDGERLVTSSDDNYAKVIDLKTGDEIPLKHLSDVKSAKFSPDSKQVATVDGRYRATVWNVETGENASVNAVEIAERILTSLKKNSSVTSVEFSEDIKRIVIVDHYGVIIVWDLVTKEPVAVRKQAVEINAVNFSPDGKQLVIASANNIATVLLLGSQELISFDNQSRVISAEFSPDSKRIATITEDRKANVWDVQTARLITSVQHDDDINSAKFSLDSELIVTASDDKTAKVVELKTGNVLATLHHGSFVKLAEFSPDGQQIVTASHDQRVKLWSLEKEIVASVSHPGPVISARFHFSKNNRRILTASWGKIANVIDMRGGITPLVHNDRVRTAEFSPNDELVVTCSGKFARIWDLRTKSVIKTIEHSNTCFDAEFSPDGEQVVTASRDETAKVLDLKTGRILLLRHGAAVNTARFSLDGGRVVTAGGDVNDLEGKAYVWNVKKYWDEKNWDTKTVWEIPPNEVIATVPHGGGVISARFSPDGERIVSTSFDGTAKVLTFATGRISTIYHQALVISAEFSSDGKLIVTASDDSTAIIWDVATGKVLRLLRHLNRVRSAKFSLDNRQIVTASEDRTAKVWDVATGRPLASLEHLDMVRSAEFSPDGKQISTSGWDGTVKVWNFAPEKRNPAVIEQVIALKVPFRFEGGALVPRDEGAKP
jgi:WD40 repeat protein